MESMPQIFTDKREIPCVLVLAKTFGRLNNVKTAKMLYKCVPNDSDLPCLLVPFAPTVALEKTQCNK